MIALQATQLDGVGTKMAMIIGNLLIKKHDDMIENKDLIAEVIEEEELADGVIMYMNSQCTELELHMQNDIPNRKENNKIIEEQVSPAHSQKSMVLVKRDRSEDDVYPPKASVLKRYHTTEDTENNDNEDDEHNHCIVNLWPTYNSKENNKFQSYENFQEKAKGKKAKKGYRPISKTSGFNILIGLYKFEAETNKKYASRKEIKQILRKNQDDFGVLKISGWTCLPTLINNGLISNFFFSDEEKFSLTETGYTVASECYLQKLQGQAQVESRENIPDLEFLESLEPLKHVRTKRTTSNPSRIEPRRLSSNVFDLLKEDSNSNNIASSSTKEQKPTNIDSNLEPVEISSDSSVRARSATKDESSSLKGRESTISKNLGSSDSKSKGNGPRLKVYNLLKRSQTEEIYYEETQKTKAKGYNAHSKAVVVNNKIVSSFAEEDDNEHTVTFTKFEKLSCSKTEIEFKEITSSRGHEVKKSIIKIF